MSDFQLLTQSIYWKPWQRNDPRYMRLEMLDRLLEGSFYDHLIYPFSQEQDMAGKYISIYQRRPSAPIDIPGMVGKLSGRKLFSGRHAPAIQHQNKDLRDKVRRLLQEARLALLLPQIAFWGSVGSVVVTFKVVANANKTRGRLRCFVWRSKWCRPTYDDFGELHNLRIAYTSAGSEFISNGATLDYKGKKLDPLVSYWRIMDLGKMADVTYLPIREDKFDPSRPKPEVLIPETPVEHKLGFVQAHWFQNLSGGTYPDGACTWEPSIPLKIELDYTYSQIGRAVRYNASPQIVTIGSMVGEFDPSKGSARSMIRAPHIMIMMKGGFKTEGNERSAGDVKLLEMTGNGIKAGMEYSDKILKLALQQIAALRKDPDSITGGVITGKAMELLDEDLVDLVQELRSAYGDDGVLPLVKKMAVAAIRAGHQLMKGYKEEEIDGLYLEWPRTYNPTPSEIAQLAQAGQAMKDGQLLPSEKIEAWMAAQLDIEENTADQLPEYTPTKDLSTDELDDIVTPAA